jgi:hypothetical protein
LANLVNECGRTELTGNIDVGENTENALAAGAVTQVQKGGELTVTIHQVNADGAGPFVCDLDVTSNSNGVSGQIPLEVQNNVPGSNGFSQAKAQDFNITVKMPADFTCTGGMSSTLTARLCLAYILIYFVASTGDVCTVRCRNNAVAGPFGGCFAVQQVDTTGKVNTPQNIATKQSLEISDSQVLLNQADLAAAIAGNQKAGEPQALKNAEAAIAPLSVVTKEFPVETPVVGAADPAATATAAVTSAAPAATQSAATGNGNSNGRNRNGNAGNNRNGQNNQNANGRNNNNNKRGTSVLRWAQRQ